MKVLPFKIPKPHQDAFYFQIDETLAFYDKFHQHEEIQLGYIVKGDGTLIVGDIISYYKTGDVIVTGSHLPHVLRSDYSIKMSRMLTLFFTKDYFGTDFFELEELKEFQHFFERSKHGYKAISEEEEEEEEEMKTLFCSLKNHLSSISFSFCCNCYN